jgi:hypothetical protein
MANMFPINSDLGTARIEPRQGYDDYDLEAMRQPPRQVNQQPQIRQPQPLGIQTVGDQMMDRRNNNSNIGAKNFVIGGSLNRDFNNRFFAGDDEALAKMNAPKETAGQILARSGIKQNDQDPGFTQYVKELDPDAQLNREVKRSQIDANQRRVAVAEGNAEDNDWKVVTGTDPNNPTKQTTYRYNAKLNKAEPIPLPNDERLGPATSAVNQQKKIEADNKAIANKKVYLDKTNESLSVIKDLMDDNGNLTTEGARASGKSSVGNVIPTTLGYSGGLKINKLRNEQVLNLIAELKQQSKTGATGMGNMSNKDLSVINNAATLLDAGLDEDEFKKQLKIVKDELKDIANRLNTEPVQSSNPIDVGNMDTSRLGGGNAQPNRTQQVNPIRVMKDGKIGYVSESKFNPLIHKRVQ